MPKRAFQGPGGARCGRSARGQRSWPARGGRQRESAAQAARGRADCSRPWLDPSTGACKASIKFDPVFIVVWKEDVEWRTPGLPNQEGTMHRTTTPLLTLLLAAVAHAEA